MRHKLLLLVLISGLLAVIAVGCAAEEAAAPEPPAAEVAEPAEEAPPAAPARITHWRFTLDWAVQGPQAPFLVALDKGYFADEGLSIVIDRGFGSADAVSKIAGGAYNLGYADVNSMIEFNVANPDQALIAVAMVLDYAPFSILTLSDRGITDVSDLEGRKLGAPAGDAPRRLFPAFARTVGIDANSVEWTSMDPPLREPLLIQGDVDAISGFYFTSFLNLTAAGVDENDIVAFLYADHGLELYGNAVIVPPSLLQDNPEAMRGFLRALTRAWQDTIANPQEAIEIIKRRDPLIDEEVELARLMLAIEANMLTPDVRERGFGDVRPERLEQAIAVVAETFELPTTPSPDQVFDGSFLPPLEDRLP
jgi:NitT/TauT family transport system substrate-binding protein